MGGEYRQSHVLTWPKYVAVYFLSLGLCLKGVSAMRDEPHRWCKEVALYLYIVNEAVCQIGSEDHGLYILYIDKKVCGHAQPPTMTCRQSAHMADRCVNEEYIHTYLSGLFLHRLHIGIAYYYRLV